MSKHRYVLIPVGVTVVQQFNYNSGDLTNREIELQVRSCPTTTGLLPQNHKVKTM